MKPVQKELIEMEPAHIKGNGMRLVSNFFLFLSCTIAILIGSDRGEDINILIVNFISIYMLSITWKVQPLFKVTEKGKQYNIFRKYIYVPVSLKVLFQVKLETMAKLIGKSTVITQTCMLFGLIIDVVSYFSNTNSVLVSMRELLILLTPVIVGVVTFGLFALPMYAGYRNAINETEK